MVKNLLLLSVLFFVGIANLWATTPPGSEGDSSLWRTKAPDIGAWSSLFQWSGTRPPALPDFVNPNPNPLIKGGEGMCFEPVSCLDIQVVPESCNGNDGSYVIYGNSCEYWNPTVVCQWGGIVGGGNNLAGGTHTDPMTNETVYIPGRYAQYTYNAFNASCPTNNNGYYEVYEEWFDSYGSSCGPPALVATVNNLTAGTYYDTTYSISGIVIGLNGVPSVSLTPTHQTNCTPLNGTVTATPSGGTAPYSYLWNTGATTQNLSGLAAGPYTVTLTDNVGCTVSNSVTVNNATLFPSVSLSTFASTDCAAPNGMVNSSVSGGVGPFTFAWNTGATTQDINGLAPGTYSVTVTGANGCTDSESDYVNGPPGPSVSITPTHSNNCISHDGSALANPSGGTSPYTYAWSTGASTINITSLSPGTYSVTVIDANNCTNVATTTINPPSGRSVSLSPVADHCQTNNGAVNSTPSGGIAPYSYNWSTGATTPNISGLAAGGYAVTITDNVGCTAVNSTTVTAPSVLSIGVTPTAATSCSTPNGQVNSSPSGGTSPYSYFWSNGATTQNISALAPGNYSVTLTDIHGCTATNSATVNPAPNPSISLSPTPSTNCLAPNGAVNSTPSGGSAPYSYAWSNGASTQNITGVSAGVYSVTLSDIAGCTVINSTTVTSPGGPSVSLSPTPSTSCPTPNGSIDATPSGGSAPYSYLWSNSATTEDISNLPGGFYAITVTDAGGCVATNSTTVNAPPIPSISISPTPSTSCPSPNGAANSTPSGGTPPYSYTWSNAATTQNINSLIGGVYSLTLTDLSGCTATATTTITAPSAPTVAVTPTGSTNCAAPNGAVNSTPSGGSPPYSYTWSNLATTQNISGLIPGIYTITVSDIASCTATAMTTVTAPATPTVSVTTTPANCSNTNGTAGALPSGGNAPYSYLWSNSATVQNINALASGPYSVTLTDNGGCTATASGTVILPPGINVSSTKTHSSCTAVPSGAVALSVNGGSPPYTYNWSTGATTQNVGFLPVGPVAVTVTDQTGCIQIRHDTIIALNALPVVLNLPDSSCFIKTASFTAGGYGPYSALWNTAATSATITAPPGNSYAVTVTDAQGCVGTAGKFMGTRNFCQVAGLPGPLRAYYCNSEAVPFQVNDIDSDARLFRWYVNGNFVNQSNLNPAPGFNVRHVSNSSNGYADTVLVQLLDVTGFLVIADTTFIMHRVGFDYGLPMGAALSPSGIGICAGDTVNLTVQIAVDTVPAFGGATVHFYDMNGVVVGTRTGVYSMDSIPVWLPGAYYARFEGCQNFHNMSNLSVLYENNPSVDLIAIPGTICDGDSVTLVAITNASNPTYAWSFTSDTSSIQTVGVSQTYGVTVTSGGCQASDTLFVPDAPNVIVDFVITPATYSIGSAPVDLVPFLTLSGGNTHTIGYFSGPGVDTASATFFPNLAGAGVHYLTFAYSQGGCTYSIRDTVIVNNNNTGVTFENVSPVSAPYQNTDACIGDTLLLTINNFPIDADQVEFSDGVGGFTAPVFGFGISYSMVGSNFSGEMLVAVPAGARTGSFRLRRSSDGLTQPSGALLLVNHVDVTLAGLPDDACSNGSYPFTTLPMGGVLSGLYLDNMTVANVFAGNVLQGNMVTGYSPLSGTRPIQVGYTFTPRYGGGAGNFCPAGITALDTVLARHVQLDALSFFPVSVSETAVPVDTLLDQIVPQSVLAYCTPTYSGTYITGTAPNFVFNAAASGAPGIQPVFCQLNNGPCSVSLASTITTLAAPNSDLLNKYCFNAPSDTIYRNLPVYFQQNDTLGNRIIRRNQWAVSASNYTPPMTPQGGPGVNSLYYLFTPANVTGTYSIVQSIYTTTIETYSGPPFVPGNLLSTRSYTVGRAVDSIEIGTGVTASINGELPFYCRANFNEQVQVAPTSPGIGLFTITKLNGANAGVEQPYPIGGGGTVLFNPQLIAGMDSSVDVTIRMVYTYSHLGCTVRDTAVALIPLPVSADFTTSTGSLQFCNYHAPATLLPNVPGGSFFINGTLAGAPQFNPQGVGVTLGANSVRYVVPNVYGCISELTKTFVVHLRPTAGLPTVTPQCWDATPFNISATPAAAFPATGVLTLNTRNQGLQAMSNPFLFNPAAILGSDLIPDTTVVRYVYTDGNGCADTVQRSIIVNPLPVVAMANLPPIFCQGSPSIALNPTPSGGTFAIGPTSTNFNTTTGVYNPVNITTGFQIITYTYTNPATGCTRVMRDTTEVQGAGGTPTIAVTTPSGSTVSSACFTGDSLLFTVTLPGPQMGTPPFFSSNAPTGNGGIISQNTSTAVFIPNQAVAGTVTVSYVFTSTTGCAQTVQRNITINALPDLRVRVNGVDNGVDNICQYTPSVPVYAYDLNVPLMPPPVIPPSPVMTMSGPGLYLIGGNYRFFPDSANVGQNVLTATYTNANGCTATAHDTVELLPNPYPILVGLESQYCYNAFGTDTAIGIPVGATGVWSITPGTGPLTPVPAAGYAVLGLNAVGTFQIGYQYTYANGCTNRIEQPVTITMPPAVSFTAPTVNQFCENAPIQLLQATVGGNYVTGGVFQEMNAFGLAIPGVVNDSFLHPGINPNGIPGLRRIYYRYTDPVTGCMSMDSFLFATRPKPIANFQVGPTNAGSYCVDQAPLTITNTASPLGSISSVLYGNSSAAGLSPVAPFNAVYTPALVGIGPDTITQIVSDSIGCADTLHREILIRDLPSGLFISQPNPDGNYCVNQTIVPGFLGFPGGSGGSFFVVDGGGVPVDSVVGASTFNLRPASYTGVGNYTLRFAYNDPFGCSSFVDTVVRVRPVPVPDYQQTSGFCQGDTLRIVSTSTVLNPLDALDNIVLWEWTYKGFSFTDASAGMVEFYNEPAGWAHAGLIVYTEAGCSAEITSETAINGLIGDTIFIYNVPFASFRAAGGCQNDPVLFVADSTSLMPTYMGVPFDAITGVIWNYGDGNSDTLSVAGVSVGSASHTYTQPGLYFPTVQVENNGLCVSRDTLRLPISPYVNLALGDYAQDFEAAGHNWFGSLPDQDAVWHWGDFAGSVVTRPGSRIWKTGTDNTFYPDNAATWVYGPCFDFMNSLRPMVKLDYIADLYDFDGAILEWYDKAADQWKILGTPGRGVDWYNNQDALFGLLGFKPLTAAGLNGWTGTLSNWKTGRYRLDELKGKNFVRMRMAFGSLPGIVNTVREGFAFDNFWVGERKRNVMFEYFTSAEQGPMIFLNMNNNNVVYNTLFTMDYQNDVVLVQYHPKGNDPINQMNSADHNARSLAMGAGNETTPGSYFLNGLTTGQIPTTGPGIEALRRQLDHSMLQDPPFDIRRDEMQMYIYDVGNEKHVRLMGTVRALQDLPARDYALIGAVVEDRVFQSPFLLQSVMRKLLPNNGGVFLPNKAWTAGETYAFDQTWVYNNASLFETFFNKDSMQGVLFIQDNSLNQALKEVYQVSTTRSYNYYIAGSVPATPEEQAALLDVKLYPNPSIDHFSVEFNRALNEDYSWGLFDASGRMLDRGVLPAGTLLQQFDVYSLPSGTYFLSMYNASGTVRLGRPVVVAKP